MIVDRVEGDEVWVFHVDKKPDGCSQPSDGRTLRCSKVPAIELRIWHLQPSDPVKCWTTARTQCENDHRTQYIPGVFDCQVWVYQCAELTEPTPSQKTKAELTDRGVNYMEQAVRLYGYKALAFLAR